MVNIESKFRFGTGKKSNNKQFDNYEEPLGKRDVITFLLDADTEEIKFMKSAVDLGTDFKADKRIFSNGVFSADVLKNTEIIFIFGGRPFKLIRPPPYKAINSAPAEIVVKNIEGQRGTNSAPTIYKNAPQAVIIEPSRELTEQTSNQIKMFKKYLGNPSINMLLVIGVMNVKVQISYLQNQGAHIIVGNSCKLEDLTTGGYPSLPHCRFFVLDDADGLLKQCYSDLIERLHKQMPKITSHGRRLQMIVCSATFEVKKGPYQKQFTI
nr:unnamed protein product [Callosobruchus chinensis]